MKRTIVMVILLVFLLVGCRGFSRHEEGDVNYRRGTQGLELRLLDRSPPFVVYEGDYLPIGIEFFNRGASEIFYGEYYITGYDPSIIRNYDPLYPGNLNALPSYPYFFDMLDKKTQFNREGGYMIKEHSSGRINLPIGTDKYRIPLTVYACYDYETILNTEICMDPEPHRPPGDKACITRNPAVGGGQAAPVAITNVDLTNMRNNMRITFTISNVGSGTIVDLDRMLNFNACPTGFGPADVDVVYLDEVLVGGPGSPAVDCSPSGRVKLVNGIGRVSCTVPIPSGTAYTTPLDIRLEYGYRTHVRREVEIRGFS